MAGVSERYSKGGRTVFRGAGTASAGVLERYRQGCWNGIDRSAGTASAGVLEQYDRSAGTASPGALELYK